MNKLITWKVLNAYVDGDLSPERSAKVARAIAADAVLAKRVARISSLKQGGSAESTSESPINGSKKRTTWLARAASVAVISLVGTLIATMALVEKEPQFIDPITYAQAIHNAWQQTPASSKHKSLMKVALDMDIHIPNLSKAELTYDGMREVPMAKDRSGLHMGYRGPSGCMVSLVAFKGPNKLNTKLERLKQGKQTVYGWKSRGIGYYLLASRMDAGRLKELAAVVHHLIETHAKLNDRAILALRQAKANATPCVV